MQAIVRSQGDGLCAVDAHAALLLMNPQAAPRLGWSQAELLGHDLLQTIAAPDLLVMDSVTALVSAHNVSGAVLLFRDVTPRTRRLAAPSTTPSPKRPP